MILILVEEVVDQVGREGDHVGGEKSRGEGGRESLETGEGNDSHHRGAPLVGRSAMPWGALPTRMVFTWV